MLSEAKNTRAYTEETRARVQATHSTHIHNEYIDTKHTRIRSIEMQNGGGNTKTDALETNDQRHKN